MPLPSSISLEVFYSALLSLASSFNSLAELPTDKILLTTLFSTLLSKPQTLLKIPRTLLTIPYETTLLPPPQTPHTGHSAPSLTSKKLCAFHRMAGADPRVCSVAPWIVALLKTSQVLQQKAEKAAQYVSTCPRIAEFSNFYRQASGGFSLFGGKAEKWEYVSLITSDVVSDFLRRLVYPFQGALAIALSKFIKKSAPKPMIILLTGPTEQRQTNLSKQLMPSACRNRVRLPQSLLVQDIYWDSL
jgi:hypothetical protein